METLVAVEELVRPVCEVTLASPVARELAVPVHWPIVAAARAPLAAVGPSLVAFEEQEYLRRQREAAEHIRARERARTVVPSD